ncbi:MAG: sigma-70 family RNA polymerase sigma factor [Acidobacteria bacterium]|nr:MAG: sigma-70 family RNA polymerase sigma factor [Acidobacteriota bacterium]
MPNPANLENVDSSAAIEELMESEGSRIYALGLRLCRDRSAAEDLAQETFLQAFRKWDQFEGRSEPSTWLYTIAGRICQRWGRRRSGEPRRLESLNELLPSGESVVAVLPAGEESPLDEQLGSEARSRLDAALAELPVRFRLPLVLKDIAELSTAQVAEVLGIKPATVKTRVHRARLALRKALAESLPKRPAAHPDHSRQVCLDLLESKQEALDRGVDFPVAPDELCTRCRSLFATLDLTYDACRFLGDVELPDELRQKILEQTRS